MRRGSLATELTCIARAAPAAAPAPALKKLDMTIARLRLLLADVTAREAALEEQRRTCREQHNKLVTFSLYGDSSLDSVLAMLADVAGAPDAHRGDGASRWRRFASAPRTSSSRCS